MDIYEASARRLRRVLHDIPEPSMAEIRTKQALMRFLAEETDLEICDEGNWFYAAYRTNPEAPSVALRADYDALKGEDGISRHLCGHDGHAAILAALGKWISDTRPARNIFLVFQPGEESGEGAKVCRAIFQKEKIDEIYGFHNIPGRPLGEIQLARGTFACASMGLEIMLTGAPAHAAYPEAGKNPAEAIAQMILQISDRLRAPHRGVMLATVIGVSLGSDRYGVSASEGVLRLTLRAEYSDEFDALLSFVRKAAMQEAERYGLRVAFAEHDAFPATENHAACAQRISQAAEKNGFAVRMLPEPMRWSEDFGGYLEQKAGAFFGIGAGETCPELHTAAYEFCDEVIPFALAMERALCE